MVAKVLSGERPGRPNDSVVTDKLWALIQRCLEGDPRRRLGITDVISYLRRAMETREVRPCAADDANVRSAHPWRSSFIAPFRVVPTVTGSRDIPSSRPSSRLASSFNLGKVVPQVVQNIHRTFSINSQGSWHNLEHVEFGHAGIKGGAQNTLPGPLGVLRRARVRFMNRGKPSPFNSQDGIPINSYEKPMQAEEFEVGGKGMDLKLM